MNKVELTVNICISGVMVFGAMALLDIDSPMTHFCGMMLFAVAIMVAGYSYLEYRSAISE